MLILSNGKTRPGPTKSLPPSEAGTESAAVTEVAVAEDSSELSVGVLSGERGQRVGHFVRNMTLQSLEHLRYLSVASAFRNVGGTLGSVALTPLAIRLAQDNAALVGGLGIGGTVAAGAIGAALGYAWLWNRDEDDQQSRPEHSVFKKASNGAMDVAAGLQSLPKFLYPTISGATAAQREVIYSALDKLPLEHVTSSATMQVVPGLIDTGISGMAQPGASHTHILLDSSYLDNPSRGVDLVVHEQAHAVDYQGGFGLLGSHNWKSGFGHGEHISAYAETNRYEDWAETYEHYYKDSDSVAHLGDKVEAIERISRQGPLSQAIDRPKVREAGKRASEAIGKVPGLRTGLELASSLIGPVQMYRGADKLIDGLKSGDAHQQLSGKLALSSGLFLSLPGGAPLALANSLTGVTLRSIAADGDPDQVKWANGWANRVLAVSAGPFGMTAGALKTELEANGMRFTQEQGFGPRGWEDARPGKGAMLKGTLATVGGAVGGSLLGASVGAGLSGAAGAAVGSMWGQVGGAMIGLGAYGAIRALKSDAKDKHPLALTKQDKKFMTGLVGGGILGAAAGTTGGTVGGRWLGETLGGMAFGPGGASVLGAIGGWTGGLAGAYGGARLGAAAGSGRLFGKKEEAEGFVAQAISANKS